MYVRIYSPSDAGDRYTRGNIKKGRIDKVPEYIRMACNLDLLDVKLARKSSENIHSNMSYNIKVQEKTKVVVLDGLANWGRCVNTFMTCRLRLPSKYQHQTLFLT